VKQSIFSVLVQKATGWLRPIHSGGLWTSVFSSNEPFPGAWQRNITLDGRDQMLSHSAVYACVTRIANDIAKMPINLVEKLPSTKIWTVVERESPFWRPLRRPNLVQNRIQFFTLWVLSKLIHGNAYILKERDERRMVVRLYVLPPQSVKPMLAPDGSVFYRYSIAGVPGLSDDKEITIPASEIIHDLMNPLFHPLCGVSPLFACSLSATQAARIQRHATTFFENRAMPSGILVVPGELPKDAASWKEEWEKNYSGANAGRVAVMGGGVKFEQITLTSEQSQLIEQLRWTVEDIARAFSMPLHKIGAGPVPTSNNVEALNQMYYDDCLQIHIESIELALDDGLGLDNVPGKTIGTEFDLENLLRMDSSTQMSTLDTGVRAGLVAINEGREKINLPPLKGGDQPYLQQQNYPLESLVDRKPPDESKPALPAPEPPPDEPDDDETQSKMFADQVIAGFTHERLLVKAHGQRT
jgi:HK97 family phage portal protein